MTDFRPRAVLRGSSWWVRLRVLLAACLLLGTGATGSLAAWTDTEWVDASFDTATIPAPQLTRACRYDPGVPLFVPAHVEIYWAIPEGYELSDVRIEASTEGLGSALAPLAGFTTEANTVSLGGGEYLTDVPTNLLTGLLGLGDELEVALYVVDGTWESERASIASNAGLLLGIGGSCRNLP